jgi:hypothetical protein
VRRNKILSAPQIDRGWNLLKGNMKAFLKAVRMIGETITKMYMVGLFINPNSHPNSRMREL